MMMRAIDTIHLRQPAWGARKISAALAREGFTRCGRKKVSRLMDVMGIRALYPRVRTSIRVKEHPRFPYLLRNMPIRYPNQVWVTDITYMPLGNTHVYLSAVIDVYSRFVVGWALHDTLETAHACAVITSAFAAHGIPSIVNTDQGSAYSSTEFIDLLANHGIRQSMDGKGRWADNIWIERWFRSLKHECVYINEYETISQLEKIIAAWVDDYNTYRPHQTLGTTPAETYYSGLNTWVQAA